MTSLWCFYPQLGTDFTNCHGVSIFDFEQVNTGWEKVQTEIEKNGGTFL